MFSLILGIVRCSKIIETTEIEEPIKKNLPFSFKFNPTTNILQFASFSDYRNYLAADAKQDFFDSLSSLPFKSLYENVNSGRYKKERILTLLDNSTKALWYEDKDVANFTRILNADGIFCIGEYCFKIDDAGKFIYVARENFIRNNKKLYFNLKEEVETAGQIFKFSTDYDILDMLEETGLPSGNIELQSILCWHRGGAVPSNFTPAVYFLDETWPAYIISFSANNPYGEPSSNSRVSLKLQYLRLGVFFQLVLNGKYDREDGTFGINGDNLFGGTPQWGTGEGNWNISFTEKHQGKCRRNNEVFNTGIISPPLNNENKTRRVFWESDNGLHKYKLTATLNLNLKRAWRGRETEIYHYVESNQFFSITSPRLVNSTEIFNFQPFEISDNY